ncbi:MAG TPA: SIS domain-containing protein [Streptosporangiaceae bacterium]|jgi:glucose/mannose-6-phosphate isomerase|nr:SIS domain-containing protein [Streptosporangiaceae bacterium]
MSDDLDGWGGAEFVLAADRLDTPDVIEAADPGDMLRQVASAAAQVRTAVRSCAETDLSAFAADGRPRAIVVAGMGGSGVAGEMLNAMAGLSSPVQVVVCQTERLPGWVGAADAVVAVSCSGSTPETLAIATEAARRGCRLAGIGAEGSPLHRIAEQARAPFVPVAPLGLARSMLWAVAVPLLVIAERIGVARIGSDVYELAASRLEEVSHQCRPASDSFVNPGKSLALDLVGELPMVWGTSALSGVAARRFASQLQENAKYPAIYGMLPEAAYSQVAAFDGPFAPRSSRLSAQEPGSGPDDLSDLPGWDLDYEEDEAASGFTALRLILIADPDEDSRVASQRAAVTELAGQRGVGISELAMDGEHPLVRLAGVIQLADYASVYLAIASGIDPGQTVAIRDLRTRIE